MVETLRRTYRALAITLLVLTPIALLISASGWLLLVGLVLLTGWMLFTRVGQQALSVARIAIATIPQRFGASAVIVVGIAGVVAVFIALLAMGAGFEAIFKQTGAGDTAIVLHAGARSEVDSTVDHEVSAIISQASQVLRDEQEEPITSSEVLVIASLPKKSSGLEANVGIRGIGKQAWNLRPSTRIIAGRQFERGLHELVVGKDIYKQFVGAALGSKLTINGQSWTVVGAFDSGDAHNSEIWGDSDTVGSAFRRGSSKTSVFVRLTNARAFDSFRAVLSNDPRLKVDVQTTRQYYSRQSEGLTRMTRILGATVGTIMSIGALFGALNSMYTAIAGRAREIATLRAIGFRRVPVVVAVLLEAMLLALLGGVMGAAIAWGLFDGYTGSTMGANANQVVFAFTISPVLIWNGLKWALAIGLIGGLLPALRAAHMPIAAGLREL